MPLVTTLLMDMVLATPVLKLVMDMGIKKDLIPSMTSTEELGESTMLLMDTASEQ